MLDVRIFKGPKWLSTGILDTSIYTKPTSLAVPLSCYSSHPEYVHYTWPLGRLRKFAELSASGEDFEGARNKLLSLLRKSSPGHPADRVIFESTFMRAKRQLSSKPVEETDKSEESWTVLPFNQAHSQCGLSSSLHNLWSIWRDRLVQCGVSVYRMQPRISWRLGGRNHINHLRHFI